MTPIGTILAATDFSESPRLAAQLGRRSDAKSAVPS